MLKIKFNKEAVKKMTRSAFIKRFEDVFIGIDLGARYDEMFPPKKKEKKEEE